MTSIVRSQNAERLLDDVPVGLENVPRFGRHFVKLITDSRNDVPTRRAARADVRGEPESFTTASRKVLVFAICREGNSTTR